MRRLATLRSQIFHTAPPPPASSPGGIRAGNKFLKQSLKGPAMLQYYPATIKWNHNNIYTTNPQTGEKERLTFMDQREKVRLQDVARKKAIGKGPPKKGECRGQHAVVTLANQWRSSAIVGAYTHLNNFFAPHSFSPTGEGKRAAMKGKKR